MNPIFTADDFGLSLAVNEAVEIAHLRGVLTHASLMVAGAAAADAVARARTLPGLQVGLHVVAVAGAAMLPRADIPDLVDALGWFPSDQFRLGLRYAGSARIRRQLDAEIAAQFAAFAATGLTLSHADAHKHMHVHPVVGALLLRHGRRHGLRRVRVPSEPAGVMTPATLGAHAMVAWTRVLRAQVRRAGMTAADRVFGIACSGHMDESRVIDLLARPRHGSTEVYSHPAMDGDGLAELQMLLSPEVRRLAEHWRHGSAHA